VADSVRVSRPVRGWLRLTWPKASAVDPAQRALLDKLENVPGVVLSGIVLELPHTAWWTEPAERLFGVIAPGARTDARERDMQNTLVHAYVDPPQCKGLFAWQQEAVWAALETQQLLLADEMGLGKSRTAIVAAEFFANDFLPERPRYIAAPLCMLGTWRRELEAVNAITSPGDLCVLRTRDIKDRCWDPHAKWYFIHYDVLPHWVSRLAMHPRGKPAVVIADEVHRMRDPQGRQAKATLVLANSAAFRMGLTGSPMDRPRDLYQPLQIVTGARTWGSFSSFRERYCGATQETGYGLQDGEPTHVDELRERMAPFFLRRTMKTSGIELPALQRRQLSAFLSPAQRERHSAALGQTDLTELVNAIVEQRAGKRTFELLSKAMKITARAKLATTVEFLEELYQQDESAVVFVHEREMAESIFKTMNGYDGTRDIHVPPWARIAHGGFDADVRQTQVDLFQLYGGVLVATYGALREGVTLTKARHVVLHDLHWNPSVLLQAEARVYRIGQERPTFAHWVTAEDSVDTLLARVILAKVGMTSTMLGINEGVEAVNQLGLASVAPAKFDPGRWVADVLNQWRAAQ
jgi:SWI/SNF-related matrix-associated actin-dependent regulator 1 of chromatin subfamily A